MVTLPSSLVSIIIITWMDMVMDMPDILSQQLLPVSVVKNSNLISKFPSHYRTRNLQKPVQNLYCREQSVLYNEGMVNICSQYMPENSKGRDNVNYKGYRGI